MTDETMKEQSPQQQWQLLLLLRSFEQLRWRQGT